MRALRTGVLILEGGDDNDVYGSAYLRYETCTYCSRDYAHALTNSGATMSRLSKPKELDILFPIRKENAHRKSGERTIKFLRRLKQFSNCRRIE